MSHNVILDLAETIAARRSALATESYTKSLLDAGTGKCSKKLGEEATEVIIAALSEDDDALANEAADLIYHLLVLLEARKVPSTRVLEILESRTGRSGHEEKASRSGS